MLQALQGSKKVIIVLPMEYTNRYRGMLRYVNAHLPSYLFGSGCAALLLILIFFSLIYDWYSVIFLALALLIILIYFLVASLWAAHQIYDQETLGRLIQSLHVIDPEETIVDIHLSSKSTAVWISRLLTTGQVIAIDIYNPQITSGRHLKRMRRSMLKPESDPRLTWRDSDFSLLPLPDKSVPAVTLVESLSEFWQEGDRQKLLKEIFRILEPGGKLLLVEKMRTTANLLLKGPGIFQLRPMNYWHDLLVGNDFVFSKWETNRDIITCLLVNRSDDPDVEQYRLL
jgi:SAM-dependent methyltransferase